MLTGAQAAQLDDAPVLFITGDVPSHLAGQGAFQDAGPQGTKDVSLYQQVVALSRRVADRATLTSALSDAWTVLEAGRWWDVDFTLVAALRAYGVSWKAMGCR